MCGWVCNAVAPRRDVPLATFQFAGKVREEELDEIWKEGDDGRKWKISSTYPLEGCILYGKEHVWYCWHPYRREEERSDLQTNTVRQAGITDS